MPWGRDIRPTLDRPPSRGTRRQRQRRKRPPRVSVPYAPTATGKAAEQADQAGRRQRLSQGKGNMVLQDLGTDTGPDLAGLLRSLVEPTTPEALDPVGTAARDYTSESVENLAEVAKRSLDPNYVAMHGIARVPDEKEVRAAADLLSVTPLGAGARGASLANRLRTAGRAVQSSKQATRAATSRVAGSAARKAGAARQGARKAAERAPKPVRTAGRAASYPVRQHPFLSAAASPAVAEVPPGGDLMSGLEGSGRLAALLGGAGESIREGGLGVPGNAISDLVSLPAQVLPSAYLTGKAAVNAAQGDTEEGEQLWQAFLEESAIPALVQGDVEEAGERAAEHPLYAALEVLGAKAVLGRGAGAIKRGGRPPEKREPLEVYGDISIPRGRYSKDAITELFQRARDRRIAAEGNKASPRQAAKYLRGRYDRTLFAGEQARRGAVNDAEDALVAIGEQAGPGNADALALAVQRIARNPDTAMADLTAYRNALIERQAGLSGGRLRANKATVQRVDRALAHDDPDALVAAADEFIRRQEPVQAGLHERGIYDPEQTERASAIGFMRQHEGAGYGKPEGAKGNVAPQMLTREGQPLSTDAIRAALAAQGADPPGFISNRPGTLGRDAFYRPADTRPTGIGQRTSGKAVLEGTSDTGFDAVARQFMGGVSRLEQAKAFDEVTRQYGLTKPGGSQFAGTAEGRLAIENPADFGMQLPDIPGGWTTRRTVPWPTRTAELEAARTHARPAAVEPDVPETGPAGGERFMAETVARSQTDGDGPVVLFPKILADRERHHFSEKLPTEKTAEAATGLFKGAVLPTSPGWLAGNIADIYGVRTAVARVTPADIRAGKGIEKLAKQELTPDELTRAFESMVPGGVFGHVRRVQPHRAAEQFVGTHLEPLWRAASAIRHAPGPEQIGNLYRRYRDAVFGLENKFIERTPQYGALAKHVRKELGMSRHQFRKAVKDAEPAIVDFVRGFRKQDNVDRAAKSIEAIYGNWGKNGPEARRFLTTWAPFWMWLRAATKFAFVTMPKDHPVLTGILVASEEMTREERQKFGLDFQGDEPAPAFLQGGIPTEDGGIRKLSNLTTFGMFVDYPENVASMAAPQFASGVLAALGLDWKADRLTDAEGRPASQEQKAAAAALTTGEAFVPFFNTTKQIIDRGFSGLNPAREFDASTVDYLRSLSESQQINVPVSGSGGGDAGSSFLDGYLEDVGGSSAGGSFLDGYLEDIGGG